MRNAGIHANSLLEVRRMYNAVGIDVSKGKSTVAVLQPGGLKVMHKISNRIFEIFFKKTLDFLLAGFRLKL